ncbi:uncharacterized protein EV422DRAFT_507865 [Fimicolochytrium jonesii]|uniref:uncharacterized protein n=1 Tax=Fimicolochytrium jonesii TaxID=1396493 RepID=UPI0022FE4AC2|nr:uncharacterized protein EV422DRAFT_507865 [Fimicolochytrium jonesii]KAI8818681.1 hypothetical protein EV422DRAFT_507865 [Fimicolochytrium jonesii]
MASADERAKKVEAAKLKLRRFQASKPGGDESRRSIDVGQHTPPRAQNAGEITAYGASTASSATPRPILAYGAADGTSAPTTPSGQPSEPGVTAPVDAPPPTHVDIDNHDDAQLEAKLPSSQNALDKAKTEKTELRNEIEIEANHKSSREEENRVLQAELALLKAEVSAQRSVEQTQDSLQNVLDKAEEEKTQLRNEIEREASHRSSREEENRMLQAELSLLKAELAAQKSVGDTQEGELRAVKSQLDENSEVIRGLREELELAKRSAKETAGTTELEETLTAERQRVSSLENDVADAAIRLQQAGEQLAEGGATISALREECQVLGRRVLKLEADKAELQNELVTLRSAIEEAGKEKAEAARAELDIEKSQLPADRPASVLSAKSEVSRPGSGPTVSEEPHEHLKELERKLAKLQQDYTASQAELKRLHLSQADVGTLLLRTGSSPTFAESLATYQRRCDELATLVQSLQVERDQMKAEVERLKTAAWESERTEARSAEMSGELSSLRESIEREREMWKGREEMMKKEVNAARSDNSVCVQLLDTLWALLRDEVGSSGDDSSSIPHTPTTHRPAHSTKAWRDGALEKAVNNLFEKVKDLKLALAEAHVVMDKQHDKIEQLLSEGATPPASNSHPPLDRRQSSLQQNASAEREVSRQDVGTQTHPMLAFARLETVKARLAEAGVIWTFPSANRRGSQELKDQPPASPFSSDSASTQTHEPRPSDLTALEKQIGALAMSHAQLQAAHEIAQAHIASLEQRLGHAKKLVVALSTGDISQSGEDEDDAAQVSEDRVRLTTTLVAQMAQIRELEEDLNAWRARCEELEEIVEEWSLGSAGGPSKTVTSPQSA